jgi:TolB-like protein/tetratricopeptide (TPR) repeat protein
MRAPELDSGEVEAQLSRILASAGFCKSQRRSALLRWLVTRALDSDAQPIKEYEIGVEVFGKPESWDPQTDSAVRVEFNRVRTKLREYYEWEGKDDPIQIEFPARGYVPVLTCRAIPSPPAADALVDVPREDAPPEIKPQRTSIRWIAVAAIACLAVFALGARFLPMRAPQPLSSVAVLPFLNLSPDHQDEYLSDGFTDELTNTLALLGGLRVVARTSAFQFKGKSVDVREIGRELGVGTVVEGSVLRSGNVLRVVAQLNRTADGMHLWAATYDREVKDMLAVQDEIAQSIAEALRVQLTGALPPAFDPGPEAHDLLLRAMQERETATPASLNQALAHLQNALRLSPRYARAYGELGTVYINRAGYAGLNQNEELRKAQRYFEDAVALDPNLSWAEAQLAYINYVLDWDWRGAESHFAHALRGDPGSAARDFWGLALMTRGRFAESQAQFAEALARDPLNLTSRLNFAITLTVEGRYRDVAEQLDFCFRRAPNWFPAHLVAIYNAIAEHRPAEALAHLEKAEHLVPSSPQVTVARVCVWIELGRRADALALLRQIERQPAAPGLVRQNVAIAYALAGDAGNMFRWLEQSADAHEEQILRSRVNPFFARYQGDPRMIALERRIGLLPE